MTDASTPKGKIRQKAILNSAVDLFIEHGYEGTSLDKIIKVSGGSRTTIYKTYGSKQGLFLAALQSMVEDLYTEYANQYDENRDWEQELIVFGKIYLTGILTKRALGAARLIYSETVRFPEIGSWFYNEGAQLSYVCFAKVLENHIDLDFNTLKHISKTYIEMLKSNHYLKALCIPSYSPSEEMVDEDVRNCANIVSVFLKHQIDAKQQ